MPRRLLVALAAFLMTASTATASLNVPHPPNCSIDPCFVTCPLGDIEFNVVVRDFANQTMAGVGVILNFAACPSVALCPTQDADTRIFSSPARAMRVTNALGSVTLHLRAGGLCPGAMVEVNADGIVVLGYRAVTSADQDGDLVVGPLDHALTLAEVGGANPGSDFNCDLSVGSDDIALLDAHLGHACDSSTPSLPRSWGRLKMLYR